MTDFSTFSTTAALKNGTPITIRAVRPDDKAKLVAAFQQLEPASIYARFFQRKRELTEQELRDTTEVDFKDEIVLVVTLERAGAEIIIGIARSLAYQAADGQRVAEIAFTVEEDYHGQGIASRLLHHLIQFGRVQQLARFHADVLPGNSAMLAVFAHSGLPMTTQADTDPIHVTLSLEPPPA